MMRYFIPRHVICRMLYRWRRWGLLSMWQSDFQEVATPAHVLNQDMGILHAYCKNTGQLEATWHVVRAPLDADGEPMMSEVHYWTGSEWLRMDRDHIPAGSRWDRLIEPKHAYICLKGARHA